MPKISFSYIFDDEIERVFECFRNPQLNMGVAYNNLVSNLKFHKGENFDEENSEFSFFWKKYYDIKMVVENVINYPHYKTFSDLYDVEINGEFITIYCHIKEKFGASTIIIKQISIKGLEDENRFIIRSSIQKSFGCSISVNSTVNTNENPQNSSNFNSIPSSVPTNSNSIPSSVPNSILNSTDEGSEKTIKKVL